MVGWKPLVSAKSQDLTPHLVFKVCMRGDLGKTDHEEAHIPMYPLPGKPVASGDDIMVVVRAFMHSREVLQVFTAWSGNRCGTVAQTQPPATTIVEVLEDPSPWWAQSLSISLNPSAS